MKIKIDSKIFIIILAYVLTKNLYAFSIIFIFLIFHEFGHIIAAVFLKLKIKEIKLTISGFKMEFYSLSEDYYYAIKKKRRVIDKIIIDMSGIVTNLFFVVFGVVIKNADIIYANTIIFLVNAFPIMPLDGGRILYDFLELKYNNRMANYIAITISKYNLIILTLIASVIVVYLENIIIGIFVFYLWYLYWKEKREFDTLEKIYKIICKKCLK